MLTLAMTILMAAATTTAPKARVQGTWQQRLTTELTQTMPDATEAWGLFSKGGWADNGQIMVLEAKDGSGHVLVVDPGRKDVTSTRTLSPTDFDTFKKQVAGADALDDVKSTAMDALVYEYVHETKGADGHVNVDKRVLYQTSTKKAPEHDAVVAAFQTLRPKRPAKAPAKAPGKH